MKRRMRQRETDETNTIIRVGPFNNSIDNHSSLLTITIERRYIVDEVV